MKQRNNYAMLQWGGVVLCASLVTCVCLEAQVVYVKCCMDRTGSVYGFVECMRGPDVLPWGNPGHSCVLGFGPNRAQERMTAMCRDLQDLPDQSDGECTVWHDESAKLMRRCEGRTGVTLGCATLFDYDGDDDVDLWDFQILQILVGRNGPP